MLAVARLYHDNFQICSQLGHAGMTMGRWRCGSAPRHGKPMIEENVGPPPARVHATRIRFAAPSLRPATTPPRTSFTICAGGLLRKRKVGYHNGFGWVVPSARRSARVCKDRRRMALAGWDDDDSTRVDDEHYRTPASKFVAITPSTSTQAGNPRRSANGAGKTTTLRILSTVLSRPPARPR